MTHQAEDAEKYIKETASYWIVRLSSPDCAPEDRCGFEAWRRADPRHQEAYERQQRGAAFVDRNVSHPLMQALAEEVRAETEPDWTRRKRLRFGAIAASLVVFIAAAVLGLNAYWPRNHEGGTVAAVEAYETAIGERSTVTLADGSRLTLNTNSRVEVAFSADHRNVELLRGQALFEVARDVDRPFIVEAGGRRITALGTAFDVRLYDGAGVEVTLIEGKVSVEHADEGKPAQAGALPHSPEVIELAPGEQLVTRADANVEVLKVDIEEATSWRYGRLVFLKEPLPDVIAEMNRYSTQKLYLGDDERLEKMTVSGVFDTGRVSGFVYALEAMHPLKAERTGPRELTLVWRE